jgi:hypothetical protein
MKKLISICFLLFFVTTGNTQVNTKPQLNELSQDQLNLALTKSKKTIKTGKILIYTGAGVEGLGVAIILGSLLADFDKGTLDYNTGKGGYIIMCCGVGISLIGLPVWIVGASKKHKITLELAKFNPPGSASINGIGLKMRF